MKLYAIYTLLVLSSFLVYKSQGIRLEKVTLSASNDHEIIKISSVKGSGQDDRVLARIANLLSGTNRKLMTKIVSSSTTTTIFKNQNDVNKHDKSTHGLVRKEKDSSYNSSLESSKHWKREVITEHYPDVIDIAGMDYTPARKKSPIHN